MHWPPLGGSRPALKSRQQQRIVGIMLGGILIVVGSFMALLFDFVAQQQ